MSAKKGLSSTLKNLKVRNPPSLLSLRAPWLL
jgi:hypothetical protein